MYRMSTFQRKIDCIFLFLRKATKHNSVFPWDNLSFHMFKSKIMYIFNLCSSGAPVLMELSDLYIKIRTYQMQRTQSFLTNPKMQGRYASLSNRLFLQFQTKIFKKSMNELY